MGFAYQIQLEVKEHVSIGTVLKLWKPEGEFLGYGKVISSNGDGTAVIGVYDRQTFVIDLIGKRN